MVRFLPLGLTLALFSVCAQACVGDDPARGIGASLDAGALPPPVVDGGGEPPTVRDGESGPDSGTPDTATPDGAAPDAGTICLAPATVCGDSCVDLQTARNHCGRCGHDCVGGGCADGACEATTVTIGQTTLRRMVASGGRVYFTRAGDGLSLQGGVFSVSYDGTDLRSHYTVGVGTAKLCAGIATAQSKAYFVCTSSTSFDLLSCDLPACSALPTVVRPNLGTLAGTVAADPASDAVYYGRGTEIGMANGGSVFASDGGRIGNVAQPNPYDMVVSSGYLYWLNRGTAVGDGGTPDKNGGVKRAAVGTTAEATVAGVGALYYDNSSLAVDSLYVYYAGRKSVDETEVVYAPLSGGSPTVFASGVLVGSVASDGTNVFFDDGRASGTLRFCPRTGCDTPSGRVLVRSEPSVTTIVVDEKSVIWATGSGSIRRIAKP